MTDRRCNLRDVASAAGCSVAAVSLALRNHASIPVSTRERIRQVAEELGYRPNPRVSELMGMIRQNRGVKGLGETVAMLWSDATQDEVKGYTHLIEFEEAARSRLESQGFGMDVFYQNGTHTKRVERILKARGIRGIILAPLLHLSIRHLNWDWNNFTVMIAGSGLWKPEFHRVRFNHFEEMAMILHHLRHSGPGRIALVTEKQVDIRSQRAMLGGFLAHVGKAEHTVFDSNGHDRVAMLRWLNRCKPEHLIMGSSAGVSWVLESGVKTNMVLTSEHLHAKGRQFPGIRQDYARLGAISAEHLVGQLTLNQIGPPEDPIKVYTTGRWEDGVTGL